MHPEVTANEPGHTCDACQGMVLVSRIVHFAPTGMVLSIPEESVIDTGRHKIAYVERMPGMFEGIEVEVGPRSGTYYPVIRGVEPGWRVVKRGAFLLDAETRLNPSLAASYFGAGTNSTTPLKAEVTPQNPSTSLPQARSDEDRISQALSALSPQDQHLARRQATCPVTGLKLGSMGTPIKVAQGSKIIFLCCEACRDRYTPSPASSPSASHLDRGRSP
jgi:hypothetical protein